MLVASSEARRPERKVKEILRGAQMTTPRWQWRRAAIAGGRMRC
jgi:hypothetical protein